MSTARNHLSMYRTAIRQYNNIMYIQKRPNRVLRSSRTMALRHFTRVYEYRSSVFPTLFLTLSLYTYIIYYIFLSISLCLTLSHHISLFLSLSLLSHRSFRVVTPFKSHPRHPTAHRKARLPCIYHNNTHSRRFPSTFIRQSYTIIIIIII